MTLGLSLNSELGLTAGIVHLLNHALMKGGLFLVAGCIFARLGSSAIEDMRGLGKRMPLTAAALVVAGLGLIGVPGITVYCASKGGVVNMTRAMALEIAPDVRVNSVCPGYVDTDMIRRSINKREDPAAAEQKMIDYAPLKRIATPHEISHAVLYLASSDARFVTGTALAIDGGSTAGH